MYYFVVKNCSRILKSVVLGFLIGVAIYCIQPMRYVAIAYVEPARFKGQIFESAVMLDGRLKKNNFYDDSILLACGVVNGSESAVTLSKRVMTKLSKHTSLLRIKFSDRSKHVAESCVSAISNKLIMLNNAAYDERMNVLNEEVSVINKQINDGELFFNDLKVKLLIGSNQNPPTLFDGYLKMLNDQAVKLSELKSNMVKINYYRIRSVASPAALSGQIEVSENSYGLLFLAVSGMIAGLVVGVLFSFYKYNIFNSLNYVIISLRDSFKSK